MYGTILNYLKKIQETSCSEKLSPDEDKITHSKYAPTLEKKFVSVINEYLNEPESYGESIDNIISLNDTSNCTNVDDSFSRMKGSGNA